MKNKIESIILYKKLLGLITKKGNKKVSVRIIDRALLLSATKTENSLEQIFLKIFKELNSSVEVKKIRVKRTIHLVPFPTTFKRRIYLIVK
jgi:ribosomal protein S7